MANEDDNEERFNPRRRLCPDGSCLGVIGPDSKCTECGRTDPEGAAAAVEAGPPTEEDALPGDDAGFDDANEDSDDDNDDVAPGFDPERRLCSDGACIGVIGSDNCCSVCRRPAKG
jgi:hypothetical protein